MPQRNFYLVIILLMVSFIAFGGPVFGYFQASISINANEVVSEVSPFIYGNNLRWIVGDKVWDVGIDSLSPDIVEKTKEIKPTIIRFPGGGLVHNYHWNDMIGPKDKRASEDENDFGPDELMLFVRKINAEPLITVNTLEGTAEEAAAWVAYMNGEIGDLTPIGIDVKGYDWKDVDYWAKEREENGHATPYNVKYWEIGNEDYFFWDKDKYYSVFEEFAGAMKRVDRYIKTGAIAQARWWTKDHYEDWYGPEDRTNFDFAVYHSYLKGVAYKYESLYSKSRIQHRDFLPVETEEGTYKFKLYLGGSGNGWNCDVSIDEEELNDEQGNRIVISTPSESEEWEWNGWNPHTFYTNEFELSEGSHEFSIDCVSGSKILYLRDVILIKKISENKFEYFEELKYNTIEESSKALWKESKEFFDFIEDYKENVKTKIAITEFNSWDYDREFVDLRDAIFIADMLIQMIKSNVEIAQYWHLFGYGKDWNALIDYEHIPKNRPNFLVYKLFSNKIKGELLKTQVNSPGYNFKGSNIPYIETVVTKDSNGKVFIAIINKHVSNDAKLNIQLNAFALSNKAKVYILNGPNLDSDNEDGNNVIITESEMEITGNNFDYVLQPHSLTVIELTEAGEPSNNPPVLKAIGDKMVSANVQLRFSVSATDQDGDSLTYSATNLPSGATFYRQYFIWKPTLAQLGSYNVPFTVNDGRGGTDTETITITVVSEDITPPVISLVFATYVTDSQAIIIWNTNEPATSQVEYGVSSSYGEITALDNDLITFHPVTLTELSPNTTYHYRIRTKDAANNEKISQDYNFTTSATPPPANNPPVLTAIGNKSVNENKQLSFTVSASDTDGDTLSYMAKTLPSGATFSNKVFSWKPNYQQSGTYYITFTVSDGNGGSDSEIISITVEEVDITKPEISSVSSSNLTQTSATISWDTNEPATSQIEYGLSNNYGNNTAIDSSLVIFHSVNLTGLTADTTYYFRVKSKDSSGNEGKSQNQTLKTSAPDEKTLAVSLSAEPSSGPVPLNKVDLIAEVSGTAAGNINYTFYCNRTDEGKNNTADYAVKYINESVTTKTATDVCDYTLPGTYIAKVIVERESLAAETRLQITVTDSTPPEPSPQVPYPDGSLMKTSDSPKVYQIISEKKLWIPTAQAFNKLSLNWSDISVVSQDKIAQYERLKLAKAPDSPKVYYLTESGLKRHIPNPEVFVSYGNKWEDIVTVEQKYLDAISDNILIRLKTGYKVYKLENGKKRWIKTSGVFQRLGHQWNQVAPVNQTELEVYTKREPIE